MRVGKERSYGRELRTEHPAGEFRLKLNTSSAINTESPIEINTKKVTTATSHNSELIFIFVLRKNREPTLCGQLT